MNDKDKAEVLDVVIRTMFRYSDVKDTPDIKEFETENINAAFDSAQKKINEILKCMGKPNINFYPVQ